MRKIKTILLNEGTLNPIEMKKIEITIVIIEDTRQVQMKDTTNQNVMTMVPRNKN